MTVYVDSLFTTVPSRKWPYQQACHLFTDGVDQEELHAFAARLGLLRQWFQPHPTLWHYDLTKNMRTVAVRMGAREISGKEYGRLLLRVSRERRKRYEDSHQST